MSTLQKAYDSVARRRASLGMGPRMSAAAVATPFAPAGASSSSSSFSRRPSVVHSPVWDGRINVEEKSPMLEAHRPQPSLSPPPNVSITASDASAPAKKKGVKKGTTTSGRPTASNVKKKEQPKRKKVLTAASGTSLSTTPVITTRSTVFTASNTAVSQHDGDSCRSNRNYHSHQRHGSLQESSDDGWHHPASGIDSSDSSHHHHHCDSSSLHVQNSNSDGDMLELEVSSQTSSSDVDFDFKMEETPMSAVTPTSRGVSSAAAESLRAATSVPPTTPSRTPAEEQDWIKLSSPQASLHDNNNNSSSNAPALLSAATSTTTRDKAETTTTAASSSARSLSRAASPSPPTVETSFTPPPPKTNPTRKRKAAPAAASSPKDVVNASAGSSQDTNRRGTVERGSGSPSVERASGSRENDEVIVSPSLTSVKDAVATNAAAVAATRAVQLELARQQDDVNSTKEKPQSSPKVNPAATESNTDDKGGTQASNPEGSSSLEMRPAVSPTQPEESKAGDKKSPGEKVDTTSTTNTTTGQDDGNAASGADLREEGKSTSAVFVEGQNPETASIPPPAEAPAVSQRQLPRYMTGTSTRPVVGVSPAAATTTTSAASSPVHSTGRARARLASTPSLQRIPTSPHRELSSQLGHNLGTTPPPSVLSPTTAPTMAAQINSGSAEATTTATTAAATTAVRRSASSLTSPLQTVALPARFSRTSSLAEPSPSEKSVARRRANRTAAARTPNSSSRDPISGAAVGASSSTTNTPSPSVLHRTNSEPINVRAYEERQRSYARPTRNASVHSTRRGTAARSLSSPPPQEEPQSPTELSFELMDRCIYQAVMVDPPGSNERFAMPPVMERPLSYYEQGMYNRHKEHAPAHYKKALLHEQRALLRNKAWLPVSRILDQRSGGVGAMMMDDFRHMARVIRYAQELDNWKSALTQRARYDAHCTELMHAAAMRGSTVLNNSIKSTSGGGVASPMAASPSAHRDNYKAKGVYHGEDIDAREISTATAALGGGAEEEPSLSVKASSPSKARAASPPPQKPTAAVTTTGSQPPQQQRVGKQSSGAEVGKSVSHNPDYSDSDVDEERRAVERPRPSTAANPSSTSSKTATAASSVGVTATTHAKTTTTATTAASSSAKQPASAAATGSAPSKSTNRAASTAVTTNATTSKKTTKGEEKDKSKKEKSEASAFLNWLAEAFGGGKKKSKKEEKSKGSAKDGKTPHHHPSPPQQHATKSESRTATTKTTSKSVAKPEPPSSSSPQQSTSPITKKTVPPPILIKPASAVSSGAKVSAATTPSAATATTVKEAPGESTAAKHVLPLDATATAAASQKSTASNAASPSPQPLSTMAVCANAAQEPPAGESGAGSQPNPKKRDVTVVMALAPSVSSPAAAVDAAVSCSSPFTEDLHVSCLQVRSARCCSVELPPAPIPVFRLYNFHPLEVVQELKRMVWWAATHRFMVFRVLTGTTATAIAAATERGEEGEESSFSVSRHRRRQRSAATVAEGSVGSGGGGGSVGSVRCVSATSLSTVSTHHRHRDDDNDASSCSSLDSRSSSMDSLDAAAAIASDYSHNDAVYFNTVLLNLRVDRWLVRHVVLTRRDAARGLVELEVSKAAEEEAANAVRREQEAQEVLNESLVEKNSNSVPNGVAADRQVASAMTYFFNSDTRTPR
jgi:trimeric autotransporter adhesin